MVAFLVAQTVKKLSAKAGDPGLILGSERSPREGDGNLLQYSCLENSMDRGAWYRLQSTGSQRIRCDRVTHTFTVFGPSYYNQKYKKDRYGGKMAKFCSGQVEHKISWDIQVQG